MDYKFLESLAPNAYLNADNFKTAMDHLPAAGYAEKQYAHGLEIGQNAHEIHISISSVWSASMKNGGALSSSEGIGYHSCTADLLRGFLDSKAPIHVHRYTGGKFTETVINR